MHQRIASGIILALVSLGSLCGCSDGGDNTTAQSGTGGASGSSGNAGSSGVSGSGGGGSAGAAGTGGTAGSAGTAGQGGSAGSAGSPSTECSAGQGIDAGYYTCKRVFFVSPSGDDGNDGTSAASAKRTLTGATGLSLVGGDCVNVAAGTYAEDITITTSGSSDACDGWVVFRSETPRGAKIVGSGYSAVKVSANYVVIDGFDIDAADGHAIEGDDSHHVSAFRNELHDCGGSGFSSQHGDYYRVEGNVVHHNAATNSYQTSGISVYQLRAILDEAPGFHNVIRGNIVYENGEWQVTGLITDGNGIIIDDLQNTQGDGPHVVYPSQTLVENNVVFSNGARGIHVFFSDHVTVRNNTVFNNNRDDRVDGTWNGELVNAFGKDNVWANNIAFRGPDSRANAMTLVNGCTDAGANVPLTFLSNLFFTGAAGEDGMLIDCTDPTTPTAEDGNKIGVDPMLVNPVKDAAQADFHLNSGSPASGAGNASNAAITDFDGKTRSTPPSIGAYEP